MAKVLITYEAEASSLKATVAEVNKANDDVVKSAQDSSKKVADAYKQTAQVAAAAFGGEQTKKALDEQNKSITSITGKLKLLYDEELKLLEAQKKGTAQYVANQKEAARLRGEIDKLTKTQADNGKALQDNVGKTVTLSRQLRTYREELSRLEQQGKENTAQFQQIAVAAARLEDQIGDTRERVRVLASDTFAFDAAIDATNQLAAGFAVAQGTAALFADDNEELQEAIAKTGAALAILNGLQQINAFVTGQSAGKLALLSAGQKVYNVVVGTSTGLLAGFKVALNAIGIGAIVAGVFALVEAFKALNAANEEYIDTVNRSKAALNENKENVKGLKQIAEDAATEIDVLNKKVSRSQADLAKEVKNAKQEFVDAQTPLIALENKLQQQLDKTNNSIRFQQDRIKALAQSTREGAPIQLAQAQQDLNESTQRANTLEGQLLANRQLQKENTNLLSTAVKNLTTQTRLEEAASKKVVKEKKVEYERLNLVLKDTIGTLLNLDVAFQQTQTDAAIARAEAALSAQRILLDQGLGSRKDVLDAETRLFLVQQRQQIEAIKNTEREKLIGVKRFSIEEQEIRKATLDQIANVEQQTNENIFQANLAFIEQEKQAFEKAEEEKKRKREETLAEVFATAKAISDLFNSLGQLSAQLTENRIAGINEASQAELAAIDNSTKTERQKQREREALELRTSRRIAQEKVKQARLDKSIALFNAVINTAEQVSRVIANPILAAIAAAAGAAQIAIIAARPVPKFAKGGEVGGKLHSQGGTLIEAERGEFVTNRRQTARHRQELDAINTSTAAFQKLINERYVRPAIQSFMLSGRDKSLTVNASLNSKSMEREIKAMRNSMRKPVVINLSSSDQRYTWQ